MTFRDRAFDYPTRRRVTGIVTNRSRRETQPVTPRGATGSHIPGKRKLFVVVGRATPNRIASFACGGPVHPSAERSGDLPRGDRCAFRTDTDSSSATCTSVTAMSVLRLCKESSVPDGDGSGARQRCRDDRHRTIRINSDRDVIGRFRLTSQTNEQSLQNPGHAALVKQASCNPTVTEWPKFGGEALVLYARSGM